MLKFQQTNTFEAFCLFNLVKQCMEVDNYKSLQPHWKRSFEQLKAKAPACLRLLLWDQDQVQLVNKFFDSTLCIQHEKIICSSSSSEKKIFCSTSVDRDTALTTFSFKSGKMDASSLETITANAKEPRIGSKWRLKAVDETHVKIFTEDGECQ
jgi:hypothetical protein